MVSNFNSFFNTSDIKRFYFPGKIFSGEGSLNNITNFLPLSQNDHIWFFIDSYFTENNFVLNIIDQFDKKSTVVHFLSGRPITEDVIKFVTDNDPKKLAAIFAIGGGSIIDFAKSILASIIYSSIDGIGINLHITRNRKNKPLFISIPTTAGSGAEASRYYVTYNQFNNKKNYGKSWELISDYIFLEPKFISYLNNKTLVECAFDVFVHLFETAICKHEKSRFGHMLTLFGISNLMNALQSIIIDKISSLNHYASLMESATIGGIAISNIRTGNIHEAAGALLEKTSLNHPQTLFIFFRKAIEQYNKEITDFEENLVNFLRINNNLNHINSINDIIKWWEVLFDVTSSNYQIKKILKSEINDLEGVKQYIFDRIMSDKVWINKESPILLNHENVKELIDESLDRFYR